MMRSSFFGSDRTALSADHRLANEAHCSLHCSETSSSWMFVTTTSAPAGASGSSSSVCSTLSRESWSGNGDVTGSSSRQVVKEIRQAVG